MGRIEFWFSYSWEAFTYNGEHVTFRAFPNRLEKRLSSYQGPVVYKWEGKMTTGNHKGEDGVYIGQAGDLHGRLRTYRRGTQPSGNKYWREEFLLKGDIRLYILKLLSASAKFPGRWEGHDLKEKGLRLGLEGLLIMQERATRGKTVWIVNKDKESNEDADQ